MNKTKKKSSNALKALFAVFVMAVFAVSIIPAAFAEDAATTDSNSVVVTSKPTVKELRDNIKADREALKQKIQEKRNSPDFKAKVEKAKEVLKMAPEQRREEVKKLAPEDFREFQKKQLMIAVDKCKDNPNIDAAKCQEKLENRVALVDKLTQKDVERLKKLEERKAEKQKDVEALKKNVAFAKYQVKKEVKAREIAKEKLQEKKEQYKEAEDKFKELKSQEKERNQLLVQVREEMRASCKADANSTECTAAREKIRAQAKEVLLKQADQMLESIEKIKAKVDSSEDLSDEEAQGLITNLDDLKTEIETAKTAINAAQTQDELIAAAKSLNQAWSKAKPRMKIHAAKVVNARIGGIIVQSKQLEVKLERVMAKMQEKGADTTKVQPLVDKFNADIASAKKSYELAVAAYKSNKTDEASVKTAQGYLNDAHKALKDARAVLVDIAKELRAKNSTDLLEDESEEAEEAVETTAATAEEVTAADTAQISVEADATETTTEATDTTTDTTAASS